MIKVQVRETAEILHVCGECEATWFSIDAIGKEPFVDFSTYMEQEGLPPLWDALFVLEPGKITGQMAIKYLVKVGSMEAP